jgi:H+/Na+-translocating ferredoxin:NAD+ oxidoreductase subunit D
VSLPSSPFVMEQTSVTRVMGLVLAALTPGITAYVWVFGSGVLIQIAIASVTALVAEATMLKARGYPPEPFLKDLSALVTACLLALSLPPLAPWWLVVVGTLFAIVVAKHLYGGLGQNLFNPAMVGFAVLLISFPAHMTQWSAPLQLYAHPPSFAESVSWIFGLADMPDAISQATPLDAMRTGLQQQHTLGEIRVDRIFGNIGGTGSEWIALAYLLGGLYLWWAGIITWHIPVAFLTGLWVTAGVLHVYDPDRLIHPWFHMAAPSTMLGAYFIATDPVSGPTTPKGKLIFALAAGFLVAVIRAFGGYPDGVAFAVLLMNIAAPFIDRHTQPRVYGQAHKKE